MRGAHIDPIRQRMSWLAMQFNGNSYQNNYGTKRAPSSSRCPPVLTFVSNPYLVKINLFTLLILSFPCSSTTTNLAR